MTRRHPLRLPALACGLALLAAPALAQTATVTGAGPSTGVAAPHVSNGSVTLDEQSVQNPGHGPIGSVLGVPVVVAAPVDAPYNAAAAYSTYGGQPGGGAQAVLSQSVPATSR